MVLNFTRLNGRNDKAAAGGRITRKFIHFSVDLSAKVMANMMEPPIWSYIWQFVSHTARLISARNLSLNRHKLEQSDPNVAETQGFREHVVLSYLYTCCKGRVIWVMSIGHSVVCPTDPVCRVSVYSDIFPFQDPGMIFQWHLT